MYLTDIFLQNVAPIHKLDLQLSFDQNKLPKPAILVGANGAGKTVVLATIADALILTATGHFNDIVPQFSGGHAYFKICGRVNQYVGADFALALLAFEQDGKRAEFCDKTGNFSIESLAPPIRTRFPKVHWTTDGNHKAFAGLSKEEVMGTFLASAYCFFPSSRRELPHWLNVAAVNETRDEEPKLNDLLRFNGTLGKPIFIERCREQNKRWILDVLFDSRTEIEREGQGVRTSQFDNLNDRLSLTIARTNIDLLLGTILGVPEARVHANYRGHGARIAIAKGRDVIIPSLDHLSLGQALLFNIFCTIARYADTYDLNKGHNLDQIAGIVVVDEIDAHLHTELQFSVLPKLLKLFPRVQFILSTHAPMFMLGMEREFGPDGVSIFELPEGDQISTERFSEFQRSLDHYKKTKAFEESVSQKLLGSMKPVVMLEGETDRDYLTACLQLSNRTALAAAVGIDWVGNNENGVAQSGGTAALDTLAKAFKVNPGFLRTKLLLLYDCDAKKPAEVMHDKLYIRTIPHNSDNSEFTRGIENLLPISAVKRDFYNVKKNPYGGKIETLDKRRLCDWVIAQKDPSLFAGFTPIIQILEEFVGSAPTDAPPLCESISSGALTPAVRSD